MPWWEFLFGKGSLDGAVRREKAMRDREDARRAAEEREAAARAAAAKVAAARNPVALGHLQELVRECLGVEVKPHSDPCKVDGWWIGTTSGDLAVFGKCQKCGNLAPYYTGYGDHSNGILVRPTSPQDRQACISRNLQMLSFINKVPSMRECRACDEEASRRALSKY